MWKSSHSLTQGGQEHISEYAVAKWGSRQIPRLVGSALKSFPDPASEGPPHQSPADAPVPPTRASLKQPAPHLGQSPGSQVQGSCPAPRGPGVHSQGPVRQLPALGKGLVCPASTTHPLAPHTAALKATSYSSNQAPPTSGPLHLLSLQPEISPSDLQCGPEQPR